MRTIDSVIGAAGCSATKALLIRLRIVGRVSVSPLSSEWLAEHETYARKHQPIAS